MTYDKYVWSLTQFEMFVLCLKHTLSTRIVDAMTRHVTLAVISSTKILVPHFNSLRPSDAYMRRRQAIIWTIAGIFLIEPLGTIFSEISIEILTFWFK